MGPFPLSLQPSLSSLCRLTSAQQLSPSPAVSTVVAAFSKQAATMPTLVYSSGPQALDEVACSSKLGSSVCSAGLRRRSKPSWRKTSSCCVAVAREQPSAPTCSPDTTPDCGLSAGFLNLKIEPAAPSADLAMVVEKSKGRTEFEQKLLWRRAFLADRNFPVLDYFRDRLCQAVDVVIGHFQSSSLHWNDILGCPSTNSDIVHKMNEKLEQVAASSLEQFKLWSTKPYNPSSAEDEAVLRELWRLAFTNQEFSLRSAYWKKLGFQRVDPTTDLRGVGGFGVLNLIYLGKRYPHTFQTIKRAGFPFAAAGLNITMMLFSLLGFGMPNLSASSGKVRLAVVRLLFRPSQQTTAYWNPGLEDRGEGEAVASNIRLPFGKRDLACNTAAVLEQQLPQPHAFEELYCYAFRSLYTTWLHVGATYMDFPRVITATKGVVETAVQHFRSIEDFLYENSQAEKLYAS